MFDIFKKKPVRLYPMKIYLTNGKIIQEAAVHPGRFSDHIALRGYIEEKDNKYIHYPSGQIKKIVYHKGDYENE